MGFSQPREINLPGMPYTFIQNMSDIQCSVTATADAAAWYIVLLLPTLHPSSAFTLCCVTLQWPRPETECVFPPTEVRLGHVVHSSQWRVDRSDWVPVPRPDLIRICFHCLLHFCHCHEKIMSAALKNKKHYQLGIKFSGDQPGFVKPQLTCGYGSCLAVGWSRITLNETTEV